MDGFKAQCGWKAARGRDGTAIFEKDVFGGFLSLAFCHGREYLIAQMLILPGDDAASGQA